MHVIKKDLPERKNNIISFEKPVSGIITQPDLKLTRKVTNIDQIYDFLTTNNVTSSGNTLYLPLQKLKHIINSNTHCSLLSLNDNIIGFVLCIKLPIYFNFTIPDDKQVTGQLNYFRPDDPQVIISGCTSYLCVTPALRNKKLGMVLIRDIIDYGYHNNIFTAYHLLSSPKTNNYTEIKMYYRVIDLLLGPQYDHHYRNYNRKNEKIDRNKIAYQIKLDNSVVIKVCKGTEPEVQDYLTIVDKYSDKQMVYYPNINSWRQICKIFKVYIVYENTVPVGCFMFNYNTMVVKNINKTLLTTILVFCLGVQPLTLKCAIRKSKLNKDIVLYCYRVGTVSGEHLGDVQALECKIPAYFERYNQSGKLKYNQIEVPLI